MNINTDGRSIATAMKKGNSRTLLINKSKSDWNSKVKVATKIEDS